ncbi:MAG: hypothetical protein L3J47_00870 [Sulfurovum sp.]|nr:hypothetical protein [Sulfurovum sp.]
MLRGFGKNYFTLSAILAHAVVHKLQAQVSSARTLLSLERNREPLEEADPPEAMLNTQTATLQPVKPCHCNCYYKRKARLVLLLNHFIPRCPFYTTFYAFRRTGVHPPLFSA